MINKKQTIVCQKLNVKCSKEGFTLLEVLMSVAIIGLLAGISIPVYRSLQIRSDLDIAVSILINNLRRAQVLSQANQEGLKWGVNVSSGLVTLFGGESFASRTPDLDEVSQISDTITFSGIDEVVFSRLLGDPINSGDIVLTALSGDTRTISINLKGSISYDLSVPQAGDWAGSVFQAGVDISGNIDGWKVWSQGVYAYLVRLGGSPDFVIVNIVDPQNPVVAGTLNLADTPENIFVSGNYAYVASRSNTQEIQIVDISNPLTPNFIGSFDASGGADGRGIYVEDGSAFLVRTSSGDDELVIVDVSNPSVPIFSGSLNLGDTGREVEVMGNYAYIASQSNSQELQIVNVSNPVSPFLAGSLDLSGIANGNTLAGFGSTVVLGRSDGEVSLIDVSVPASPAVFGSLDTGGSVNDLSLGNSNVYVFLAGNTNNADFQVLDISSVSSPAILGTLDLVSNLNGIYYVSDIDRVVAVGDDDGAEFVVIAPQ